MRAVGLGDVRRWRPWAGPALLVVAVLVITVLAVRAEGFHATRVNLHDGGVWVVNQRQGEIGRINTQTASIEVALGVEDRDVELQQWDDTVVVEMGGSDEIAVVDVALAELGRARPVGDQGEVHLGGPTAAVADPDSGKVWVTAREDIAGFDPVAQPRLDAPDAPDTSGGPAGGEAAVTAVGPDGTVHAYTAGAQERRVVARDGEPRTEPVPVPLRDPQLTVVGDQPVLLEPESGRLVLPGGETVELGENLNPRLQQPGEADGEVLVATDDALLAVRLDDGSRRTVADGGTRAPVAPVKVAGCAYGAWAASPRWVQVCPGHDDRGGDLPRVSRGSRSLRFRVNRDRVVLNDAATGYSLLLFTDRPPVEVDNWEDAEREGEEESLQQEQIIEKPREDCGEEGDAGVEARSDTRGTRPGRPVVVPVLENDLLSRCHVPLVSVADPPPADLAQAAVVGDGTAIQVTPRTDRPDPIELSYQVTVGDKQATARITVTIVDPTANRPPQAVEDHTTVVAGRTVRHDVLGNDHDPDGDALTLVGVTVDGEGSVTHRADGTVGFTAPGATEGERHLRYTVADEDGATAEGTLKVVVVAEGASIAPTARHDRADLVVGRRQRVPVLANDSDADGDPLTVADVSGVPGDLEVQREADGTLSLLARRAGTYTFRYRISDGEHVAEAKVLAVAVEPDANRPPVAVRDDLPARPGVPAYRDLLANDVDPDGDLLAAVSVRVPDDAGGLSVELLDLRLVRVTAPAGFSASVPVRYTVSDGTATAEGVLVVRPYLETRVDQPPVTADDEVTVRAGNVTAIPVLANDSDPEGEHLELRPVPPLGEQRGQAFVQGDQLRYEAPPTGPATVRFTYTVADPGGNVTDGVVTVRVLPADHPNQPPVGPSVEARVFAGSETVIPVPLVGLDPDGDVVTIVGVSEADGQQPGKGHATAVPTGLRYRADRGAAGTDTFSFIVRDAHGLEAVGQARVAVVARPAENSPPVAVPDRVTVRPGATVPVPVLANDVDPDGDPLTVLAGGEDAPTQPRGGRVTVGSDGRVVLTVDAGAPVGDVSFTYVVTDGRGGSARGTVTISVRRDLPDQPPVARDDVVAAQAPGASVDVDVLGNDHDPDTDKGALKVSVVSRGVDAAVLPDGRVRVQVTDRSVSFVYAVEDPAGLEARAVVTIPVLGDRPPACEVRSVDVDAGGDVAVDVLAGCTDPDGRDLSLVRVLGGARGGTPRIDGNRVVFTADADTRGDAGFTFVVSDGTATGVGGIVVRVNGGHAPPEVARTRVELPAGSERVVDLQALVTDLDPADRHSFSDLAGTTPQIGAELDGSRLRVRAGADARGAVATLTVTVSDGTATATAAVDVEVLRYAGAPPVAVDDGPLETIQDRPVEVDVTANDVDPAGEGLTVEHVASAHGAVSAIGTGRIRFTPTPGFFGEAVVTYRIQDAARDPDRSSAATVRINVIGRPSRPPAPVGVRESRLVRLTWGAAAPNGGPITEYVVENDRGERRSTPSTSMVFDGLTNGTPYRFRVAAVNKAVQAGDLLFSEWSSVLVPDVAPGTPAPPVLAFGNGLVRVSWTPPANEGSAITKYWLRISGGSASEQRDVGTGTSYVWTGLTNGVRYSFSVQAENGAGKGEWSGLSHEVPAGPPGPVPGVAARRVDPELGQAVQVTWGSPAPNGDDRFTFQVGISPAHASVAPITNAAQRSVVVPGLRNGVRYTFTVTATNKAGTGPAGSATAVPAARPSAVGAVRAEPRDRAVTLQAAAPADNGAPITGWQVSVNGGGWRGVGAGFTVDGLANGSSYSFRLRACNEVGCSNPSPASNTVVPFGNPSAPSVNANVNGSTIRWSWSAADGNGRAVDHYEVYLDASHVGNTSDRSYSREFANGGRHTLSVVAVNREGRRSGRSNTAAATAQPRLHEARTYDNGVWKDTFEIPGGGASGVHANEAAPGAVYHVICRRQFNPDIRSGSGWWYKMQEFNGRWMTSENFYNGPDASIRICS